MNFYDLNSSEWQNFIYTALLLSMMLGGLLLRKDMPISKALKYLAMWSVVALVAVSLYSYRFEFSDFKARIIGEIAPSRAQINKEGQIIINSSSDGHFYINLKKFPLDIF